jgi:chromosome segregation ATPase
MAVPEPDPVCQKDLWALLDRVSSMMKSEVGNTQNFLSETITREIASVKNEISSVKEDVNEVKKSLSKIEENQENQLKAVKDKMESEMASALRERTDLCKRVEALEGRLNFYRWLSIGALSFAGSCLLIILAAVLDKVI